MVTGGKLIIDLSKSPENFEAYKTNIYKTAVATIEHQRKVDADFTFAYERTEGIQGFALHGIDNYSFTEFNNIRKQQGKREIPMRELKLRVENFKKYQQTGAPDVYFKPRSTEKLYNY